MQQTAYDIRSADYESADPEAGPPSGVDFRHFADSSAARSGTYGNGRRLYGRVRASKFEVRRAGSGIRRSGWEWVVRLAGNVFDVWAFQRQVDGIRFLLLYTSEEKAARHFNGARFWQIPSGQVHDHESMTDAVRRVLGLFGLRAGAIWAAEHAYVIYNRRFEEMQAIGVFAAEVAASDITLTPSEHSEYEWCTFEVAHERVHYRGLKEGLRSVREYVTGVESPAKELCLYSSSAG